MGCCGDASSWSKVGLISIILAFGTQIAGFVTNNWMNYNTVKDAIDIRVGLWWFTNCSADITCYTDSTPSTYKSLSFTLTQCLEGGVAGCLLIAFLMYCFYVMSERSRTKVVAVAIVIFLVFAVACSVAGLVFWIMQINFPYFVAWSAGLSVVATALSLIATLCLVPDLKEYPYEKLQVSPADKNHRPEKQTFFTKHGSDNKKSKYPGNDQRYRDPYANTKSSRDLDYEYGRHDPYVKKKSLFEDDSDRFSLNVVTPSIPPRGDFFVNKPSGINRY